jgi:MbtH protein
VTFCLVDGTLERAAHRFTRRRNVDMTSDDVEYKVVVNDEEQHTIWPAHRTAPSGWREIGVTGPKELCLAHIREAWPDITPLSVRKALRKAGA